MLPGETYREEKDPALCDFPPGLANRLQRGAEIDAASGDTPTTAKPTGPTWGGGRCKFAVNKDGVVSGTPWWVIDDEFDYNDRFVIAFGVYYTEGNKSKLPGESTGTGIPQNQPDADAHFGQGTNPTQCGVCMGYLHYNAGSAAGRVLLHYNGSNALELAVDSSGRLVMINNQASTVYPCIMFLITDQFPART